MQLSSATDRANLVEERAALRREASLRRIATLVAGGVTPAELFSAVAREVSVVLDAPVVTVDRYELDDGSPVSVVIASLEDEQFPVGSRWPLDGPSARAWIYKTRRPTRIEDFAGLESTVVTAARQQGVSWVVGAPIMVDGGVWGNICAGTVGDEPIPDDAELRLADFTDLVSTAIASSNAREEVGRLLDEQTALRRVATLVAGGAPPSEVFDAVAMEVAQILDLRNAAVCRYDDDGAAITVMAAFRERPSPFQPGSRWPLDGPSLSREVFRTGRPVRIDDYTDLPGTVAAEARRRGYRRVAGAPIIVDGRVWGVISTTSQDAALPEELEDRLGQFTQLVATAIANADGRAELAASEARARELAEEQAALRRLATFVARERPSEDFLSAVAGEVASVLKVSGVLVDRFEPDGSVVTVGVAFDSDLSGAERIFSIGSRMPPDPGSLVGQVFETHRTARVDDFSTLPGTIGDRARAAGLESGCGGPIVVDGELWGLLCVLSRSGKVLPAGTQARLHHFVELVATAIANYEARADLAASEARARELANEQAALRRVATLVAQGASPDDVFSAVATEVAGVIDVPIVGIRRFEADGTFTVLGNAGATSPELTVGSRWPVAEGMTAEVLATGSPVRKDGWMSSLPGPPVDGAPKDQWISSVTAPIVVEGNVWGFLGVADKSGGRLPADTEERLVRFTELVATAVLNATTRTELLTSRTRLVSAADETRRRLERDLHDGIQQWLVALALKARRAAGLSPADESAARELSGLADDLVAVTDELREISRGIHPAVLSDAGLDDALGALARRSAIRVDLNVSFQGRYDPALEATVYYVAAESITNAVKHAQASKVTVRGRLHDGAVELEISDDGVGGADPGRGTGLIGLKDRVDTLGGTISFASLAGAGTTIRVRLPALPPSG